jgi:hypothetical protein
VKQGGELQSKNVLSSAVDEYIFDSALQGSRWGKLQSEHVFSSAFRMTIFLTVLSEEAGGGNDKVNIFLAVLLDDYIFDSALRGSRWGKL